MSYAEGTSVPVERSQAQIQQLIVARILSGGASE